MTISNHNFTANQTLGTINAKSEIIEQTPQPQIATPEQLLDWSEAILNADEELNSPHTLNIGTRVELLKTHMKASVQLGDIKAAWRDIEKIVQLRPYFEDNTNLIPVIASHLRTEPKTKVVLLISCWPRLELARKAKAFLQTYLEDGFRILIVLGKREPSETESYIDHDMLMVDAPDNYESLSYKVRAAFQFIYKTFGEGSCCFKIDEDIKVKDGVKLAQLMTSLDESRLNYSGICGNIPFFSDRTWHFGKCQDKTISRRPLGRRQRAPYAYGPFYYLSATALEAFVLETMKFPDEICGQIYEDVFIGNTLFEAGVKISPIDPNEWSTALVKDWWISDRCFGGPTNKLN